MNESYDSQINKKVIKERARISGDISVEIMKIFYNKSGGCIADAIGVVLGQIEIDSGIPSDAMIDRIRKFANYYKEEKDNLL